MSRIVATFDPSAVSSDTFNCGFANGTGKMIVYNESNINLQLSWGSFSTYCPAWMGMLYCVSTNDININWEQHSQLASNGSPISMVIVEAYSPNEQIIGTYPVALVRQANIGNAGSVMSATTSIQNDGNVPGTQIIEATPNDALTSTFVADNKGNLTVKSDNAGVLTTLLQLIAGASPAVKLAAATVLVEALGSMQVDSTLTVVGDLHVQGNIIMDTNNKTLKMKDSGGTSRDVLYVDANGETCLQQAGTSTKIFVKNNLGNNLSSWETAGQPGGSTFRNAGAINANTTP